MLGEEKDTFPPLEGDAASLAEQLAAIVLPVDEPDTGPVRCLSCLLLQPLPSVPLYSLCPLHKLHPIFCTVLCTIDS